MGSLDFKLTTPVAFIIFNRPDTTKRVFEEIRKAKPTKLLIIADGPRDNRPGEDGKCAETRAIVARVDWECEILTNYSDVNMGCGKRPATGISWVFEQVEEAIFLEDDCLPHPGFFRFCQEMLERFRADERVGAISGTNINELWKDDLQSYHFSYLGGNWGWASWARAWKGYDYALNAWQSNEIKERVRDIVADEEQFNHISKLFDETYKGCNITWWDYQWMFLRFIQSRVTIVPSKNLISNIGFQMDATHTTSSESSYAEIPSHQLSFPLRHNEFLVVDREYDRLFFKGDTIVKRLLSKVKKIIIR